MADPIFETLKPLDPNAQKMLRVMVEDHIKLGREIAGHKETLKALNENASGLASRIIAMLAEYGIKTQKFDDGISVSRVTKKYPRVPPDKWDAFKKFAMRVGLWKAAKVPTNTVNAFLKDRIEAGKKIPPYIEVFEQDSLAIRGKNKLA